jgi:hypothetical protein
LHNSLFPLFVLPIFHFFNEAVPSPQARHGF